MNNFDKLYYYKHKYKFYKNKYLQSGGVKEIPVTTLRGDSIGFCNIDFNNSPNILDIKEYIEHKTGIDKDCLYIFLKYPDDQMKQLYELDEGPYNYYYNNYEIGFNDEEIIYPGIESIEYRPDSLDTKIFYLDKKKRLNVKEFSYCYKKRISSISSEIKNNQIYKLNNLELELLDPNEILINTKREESYHVELFAVPSVVMFSNKRGKFIEKLILEYLSYKYNRERINLIKDNSVLRSEDIFNASSNIEQELMKNIRLDKLFDLPDENKLSEIVIISKDSLLDVLNNNTLKYNNLGIKVNKLIQREGNDKKSNLLQRQHDQLKFKLETSLIDTQGVTHLQNRNYILCSNCKDIICNLRIIRLRVKQGDVLSPRHANGYLNSDKLLVNKEIELVNLMHLYGRFINENGWKYIVKTFITENLLNANYSKFDFIKQEYPNLIELFVILQKFKWLLGDYIDKTPPTSVLQLIEECLPNLDNIRDTLILVSSQLVQFIAGGGIVSDTLDDQIKIICSNNKYYKYAMNLIIKIINDYNNKEV